MADVIPYPTLTPTGVPQAGQSTFSGGPSVRVVAPWSQQFSDQSIRGAAKIDPARAQYVLMGGNQGRPVPGTDEPQETKDKKAAQIQATIGAPNWFKRAPLPLDADQIRFGFNPPQKPTSVPWKKRFVPPLALFNDAGQWVNRLMFNRPMRPTDTGDSMPALKAQYFTPPPILVGNYAAGAMNMQLQLGMIRNQVTQLTTNASNFFGGT